MSSLNRTDYTASTLASGLEMLLRRLGLCRYIGDELLRIEVPIEAQDCLQWLASLPSGERYYFSCRDQSLSVAGIGTALELKATSPSAIPDVFAKAERLVDKSNAFLLGGCSFSGRSGAYQWQGFPGARFVLPLIEIRQQDGAYMLAFNVFASSFAQWQEQQLAIHSICRQHVFLEVPEPPVVKIKSRRNSVDAELWQQQVQEVLQKVEEGSLQKVVLAREVSLELSSSPDPMLILAALETANPDCFSFAMEMDGKCFFGCSPERLLKRQASTLHTEALAGTVRRGKNHVEDLALERVLRKDGKLIHEHKLVAKAIKESLTPFATLIEDSEPVKILKLNRVQHRCQPLTVKVSGDSATGDLYRCLHPTPAICGYPSARALSLINDIEQICRGWYSGSVGIIGHGYCELSVAIRSALLAGNKLWLYSGVGIVSGSHAQEEWQELESKLESMLQAIGSKVSAIDYNVH
ncbi:isochorismate synthase [Alteromonadaceae bacterium Bs31]|nr:isochorismate synthase [Alteromonadaceae bacterium Bs31]